MTTIRERVAEFNALAKAHPDERYLCMGVNADRRDLLVAGDRLAAAAGLVANCAAPEIRLDWGPYHRLREAIAAWKAATG